MALDPSILYTTFDLGGLKLRNRFVMAPLTRNRAIHGTDVPQALNVEYYAERASDAGLIISEATQISPTGKGYAWTPGIYSKEQVAGWKRVTQAVHDKGGLIFCQLWHVGRMSDPSLQPNGITPVAPSAIAPVKQRTYLETGKFTEVGMPRALKLDEIAQIIEDYRKAAQNAMAAGFDGIEIHGANGYLIQQFLSDRANQRDDQYGGPVANRLRFAIEVTEAVAKEVGAERTAIRLSPVTTSGDALDSDPTAVYFPLVRELNKLHLSYIHVVEGITGVSRDLQGFDFHALRKTFKGAWMVNNGYNLQMAADAITSGYADLVAFGKLYIANPDLAKRFKLNATLNTPDAETFYGGDAKGYTDYPELA